MKTFLWITAAVLLGLSASIERKTQDTDLTWHSDLAAATRLAEKSGRPMLIVFR